MADNVSVIFSAQIGQLIEGVDEVKQAILSIKDKADSITSTFESMAAVIGVSFGVEGIKSFVENMANLGMQTERSMATLGLTAQETVNLGAMAKLTGSSMEGLTTVLGRMALNIEKSTKDGFNPAAQGLQVLGLRAKDLIGIPTSEYIDRLRSSVSQFNPSMNLFAAVAAVGGRGMAQMIPLLQMSNEKWADMKLQITAASEGLAAAIPGMADTHAKLTIMGEALSSFGSRIFTILKPAIDAVISAFTNFIESMTADKIRSAVFSIIDGSAKLMIGLIDIAASLGTLIDDVITKFNLLAVPIVVVTAIARGLNTAIDATIKGLGDLAFGIAKAIPPAKQAADGWQALRDKVNGFASDIKGAFLPIVTMKGFFEQFGDSAKKNAAAIATAGKDIAGGQLAAMQGQIKAADAAYKLTLEQASTAVKSYQITEDQKTKIVLAAILTRENAELTAINGELAHGQLSITQRANLENQKTQIIAKANLDRQKIVDEAVIKEAQTWKEGADQIAGAFNSQLRGLLSGQETFGQAMKKMSGDLIIKLISDIDKWAIEWLAAQLRTLVMGNAMKATDVATTSATEAAKTGAVVTGAAARASAETAGASVGIIAQIGNALAVITADAAKTFAGVFAFLAPAMGPAAVGPATASAAEVEAAAVGIVGLASGTDRVLSPGLAYLHSGEKVVPAQTSGPFTGSGVNGAGGDINVHFNLSAIDTQTGANFLQKNATIIARVIAREIKNGNPTLLHS
jgi:hypothetical protein